MLATTATRPHPPQEGSTVLGTVTRLSPLQATVSISVVDGIALSPGEDFNGVIRTQDVRATEQDKVKMSESFRGGDVVRGVVVRLFEYRGDSVPRGLRSPCSDLVRRCEKLLHHYRAERSRRDIRNK